MEKKTKLTISGNTKKSIDNIELARLKNKNSVVIEKKPSRFSNNNPARKASGFQTRTKQSTSSKEFFLKKKNSKNI